MKTEILKQDLKMLNVALECYMGKDLEEDSNLSRPVKQALKDFEELIDKYTKFNEDKSCTYMCDVKCLLEEELSFCKEELEIYKKSFEKSCSVHIHTCIAHDLLSTNEGESGNITYVEEFENEILEQVRKEIENGK